MWPAIRRFPVFSAIGWIREQIDGLDDPRVARRVRHWLAAWAVLLTLAGVTLWLPWEELAIRSGQKVRPTPAPVPEWVVHTEAWCAEVGSSLVPFDRTTSRVGSAPGFGRFSLVHTFETDGYHPWWAVACSEPSQRITENASWALASEDRQAIELVLEVTAPRSEADAPSIRLDARDGAADYIVVGDFQGWNEQSERTRLRAGNDRYWLAWVFQEPGPKRLAIVSRGSWLGFADSGRSVDAADLEFATRRAGELVVIELDAQSLRPSAVIGVPPLLATLAWGGVSWVVPLALFFAAGLAFARALVLFVRFDPLLRAKFGCPRCGSSDLLRIPRRRGDRRLAKVGFLMLRHRCQKCGWTGLRTP